ncbi:MAG TPA: ABC transporter permease [Anaerolineae bacterium]|nr:ABC transporter permease [Anaerolineae bacterium]HIQ06336.1 ABC transporter permease [Anaerolineae bacterium]
MPNELLQYGVLIGVLASGVRLAAPFLYAALGEMFAERAGVLNLGVEGIMLMGAFSSFWATLQTGSLWLGLLMGMAVGGLMGLAMAVISVTFKAEQGISGIGLYLFGWGLSSLLFRLTIGSVTGIQGFAPVAIPLLSDLPLLGAVLFRQNLLVYLALLLVPISHIVLFRTTFGLKVRAVGEHPAAADTLGVNVYAIQYICVVLGGVLAGLAGAFLTLGHMNMFVDNISAGRGFIAIALVYFGRWRPWGILAGSLLFSVVDALQIWAQVLGVNAPYEAMVVLPYALTIVVLALAVGRSREPAAINKPYTRGEA